MNYNKWSEYRRRNRIALAVVFGGLLGVAGIGVVFNGVTAQPVLSMLITAWFIGSIVATFRAAGFHCPRCGERFFQGIHHHNGFARRCVHCGLPKWDEV